MAQDVLESEYPLDSPYELEGIEDIEEQLDEFVELLQAIGIDQVDSSESSVGVKRVGENAYGTWGYIFVWNGSKWEHKGYTLEPRSSVGKGPIPIGTYSFKRWLSTKLGKTLRLYNVPGFTDILVHVGNTQSETKGCILAAKRVDNLKKPTRLVDSRSLTDWLYDNCEKGRIQIVS